ncbi:MAG: A/G-specific adenine glycosylase [Clostridiales bacterium]|nr:A/G-specific adenine glycosylase [Clostridiales bacterium]
MSVKATAITSRLLAWYDAHQRVFPFRGTKDPYRIWLSEIMLQQTRTETVGPYYERFLRLFPDVHILAKAPIEQVLKAWEGLGYYTRARNLHKTAGIIVKDHGGVFPSTAQGLQKLPGIGPYAAAAIASIAYGEPVPAMDGNLYRVISRLFLYMQDTGTARAKKELQALGLSLMPHTHAGDMNQALMDLGATICLPGTPDCDKCPLSEDCAAFKAGNPASLPMMKAKKPPKQVPVSVVLLVCDGHVLLLKREKALLKGMYLFVLSEGEDSLMAAEKAAKKYAKDCCDVQVLGTARHVFTHQVWNMTIYLARARSCAPVKNGVWASCSQLDALPVPVAMNAALSYARKLVNS